MAELNLTERMEEPLCRFSLPELLVRALDQLTPDAFAVAAAEAKLPRGWERIPWRTGGLAVIFRQELRVLLSLDLIDGVGWLHASVSRARPGKPRGELPSWAELKAVRSIFLGDDVEAVQWFPANTEEEWVDLHECLHLWRRGDGLAVVPRRRPPAGAAR